MNHKHSIKSRSGHKWKGTIFPVFLVGALCLWATVPFGSVTLWARSVVSIACLAVTWLLYVSARERREPAEGLTAFVVPACFLGFWFLFQTIPLPVSVLRFLQPFARTEYQSLFGGNVATAISFDVFKTHAMLVLWLSYGFLGWASYRFLSSKNMLKGLFFTLTAIGVFQTLFGLVERTTSSHSNNPFLTDRLIGTFSSGNSFGGFLVLTIPVTLSVFLAVLPQFLKESSGRSLLVVLMSKKQMNRFLTIALIVLGFTIQFVGLLLSGSRGAIISTIVSVLILMVWFIFSARHSARSHMIRIFLIGTAMVGLIGLGGTYAMTMSRFQTMADGVCPSAISRFAIWKSAMLLFVSHPLGIGLGCFEEAFSAFQPPGFNTIRVYHAHNDYIELLCELGMLGFIPLLFLMIRGISGMSKLWKNTNESSSVWLWRGAMLAVFACMLHAFVDFNLTSRPGITVTFVVLLGVVLGYVPDAVVRLRHGNNVVPVIALPRKLSFSMVRPSLETMDLVSRTNSDLNNIKESRRQSSRSAKKWQPPSLRGICVLSLVCLSLGWCSWKTAGAMRLMESGRVALGGAPDRYFRFAPAPVAQDKAVELLKNARDTVSRYGWAHYTLGMGRIMEFEKEIQRYIQENMQRFPESFKEDTEFMVRQATARERVQVYAVVMQHFERASALSPWNPDVRARLCLAMAESVAVATNTVDADMLCESTIAEAHNAVMLAPNDATTLRRVCVALTTCYGAVGEGGWLPQISDLLRIWGHRTMQISSADDEKIIACWNQVGVPVLDVMSSIDTPHHSLWKAYQMFDKKGDQKNCLRSLEMLESICSLPLVESDVFNQKTAQLQVEKFRRLAIREKCRWMLRVGAWSDYHQYAEQRHMLYASGINKQLKNDARTPMAYYIKLKSIEDDYALDIAGRLDLCGILFDRGENVIAEKILAEESCRDSIYTGELLYHFAQLHPELKEESYGQQLMQSRLSMFQHSYDRAQVLLIQLCEGNDIPFRFKHRVRLMLAQCLFESGENQEAANVLLEAAKQCSSDKDVLSLMIQNGTGDSLFEGLDGKHHCAKDLLSSNAPEHSVGTRFMAGRVVLEGFDLQESTEKKALGDVVLRVHWRFAGMVPDDLEMVTITKNPTGPTRYWNGYEFSKKDKLMFSEGLPLFGCTIISQVHLHRRARLGNNLLIGLRSRSKKKWLQSEEGLALIEIRDWKKYINIVHEKHEKGRKTELGF